MILFGVWGYGQCFTNVRTLWSGWESEREQRCRRVWGPGGGVQPGIWLKIWGGGIGSRQHISAEVFWRFCEYLRDTVTCHPDQTLEIYLAMCGTMWYNGNTSLMVLQSLRSRVNLLSLGNWRDVSLSRDDHLYSNLQTQFPTLFREETPSGSAGVEITTRNIVC